MPKITRNADGSITITETISQDVPQLEGGTKPATTFRVWDIAAHQLSAVANDPAIYKALPDDLRAEVDAQRAKLDKAKA